jgi:hypothetical protein
MDYQTIKEMILSGDAPEVGAIDEAITSQTGVVLRYAVSVAKHNAILKAADFHPWPVQTDQAGRVERRASALDHEHLRLSRLFFWRELAEKAPRLRPEGLGSA